LGVFTIDPPREPLPEGIKGVPPLEPGRMHPITGPKNFASRHALEAKMNIAPRFCASKCPRKFLRGFSGKPLDVTAGPLRLWPIRRGNEVGILPQIAQRCRHSHQVGFRATCGRVPSPHKTDFHYLV
jgi:hypothetical protein